GEGETESGGVKEDPGEVAGHNERLEFLGDAVITLAVSQALFERHPDDDEGQLSVRRAAIVSATGLAGLAERIDLGAHLAIGEGEVARDGQHRPSILASTFEAVVGAILLDLGWEPTPDWASGLAPPEIEADQAPEALKSRKSRLQEETQRVLGERPEYRLLEAVGPDHDKVFRVEVVVGDEVLGMGVGGSRRLAETAAAAEAVEILTARSAETAEPAEAAAEAGAGAAPLGPSRSGCRASSRSPHRPLAAS